MNDVTAMGTLLSRMTKETSDEVQFNSDQVNAMIEILVPTMITDLPGMPKGMKVTVNKDATGWDIRVERP